MPIPRFARTAPLPESIRAIVTQLARERGALATAELLSVGKDTVARAGIGLAVRPSVAHAIASRLELLGMLPA